MTLEADTSLDMALERMDREEFDMIAVGRALLANADWARVAEAGQAANLNLFDRSILARLE
jgi:2,4-dienoyl-CoA reductase-like NADH-dependent reductase (Old Yellow Enzyme family)